jgi:UDP-2,3-diacylglucosamine hydrolase
MNMLVHSDLHLGPDTTKRNQLFLEFLETAAARGDSVLIVGDLFDLWFGWPSLTMEYQKPILTRMQELVDAGLHLDYVEGNRDFGIQQLEGILFRKVTSTFLQTSWEGKRVHVEHGDLLNLADRQYRAWRRISKNGVSYFLLGNLPSFVTLRLALRMEKGMRATNQKHKMYYPEMHVEQFITTMGNAGMDWLIVGHFHMEKRMEQKVKNRSVLFFNLPGWEQGFRYLVLPSGNGTPYFTDWGKQNGNSATA